MHLIEATGEALRTMQAQKLRTTLTMFGVVWGTASLVFLISWGIGVQRMLEEGYARIGKNVVQVWAGMIGEQFTAAGDRRELWFTRDDVEALRRRSRQADLVTGESRMFRVVTWRQRAASIDVRGVEAALPELRGVQLANGRVISHADVEHRRRVVVLGAVARHRILGAVGGVDEWIRIGGMPFRVIGVLAPIGSQLWQDGPSTIDEQAWIPLTTLFGFGPRMGLDVDVVDSIGLHVRDRHDYPALQLEVREILSDRLRVSVNDEEAIRIASPIDALNKLPLDQMSKLLFTLGATTLMIGGVGIVTMMLDAVYDRQHEIGVRLAVGARRRDVIVQFFLETFVMMGIGGTLGLILAIAGCWTLARMHVPDLIPVPILRADVIALGFGVTIVVGVLAGIVPAWRAARVQPSITLRAG